ncbi:hypothetical protein OQA88_8043 [Cercophora sp. LCS_1]
MKPILLLPFSALLPGMVAGHDTCPQACELANIMLHRHPTPWDWPTPKEWFKNDCSSRLHTTVTPVKSTSTVAQTFNPTETSTSVITAVEPVIGTTVVSTDVLISTESATTTVTTETSISIASIITSTEQTTTTTTTTLNIGVGLLAPRSVAPFPSDAVPRACTECWRIYTQACRKIGVRPTTITLPAATTTTTTTITSVSISIPW